MIKQYSCKVIKKQINDVFNSSDSLLTPNYKIRFEELNEIFTAQLGALDKIYDQQFFPILTEKFYEALERFLRLAVETKKAGAEAKNAGMYEYLVNDSYTFIRAFDNALQGYLNSDRQFLEFPGHYVSLYDLPAKLGVFYIKFINEVIATFKTEDETISYLLCPEPFDEEGIHVKHLLSGIVDDEELLIIDIPAKIMFNPEQMFFALTHEIAHYVGRSHRLGKNPRGRNALLAEAHMKEQKEVFAKCFTFSAEMEKMEEKKEITGIEDELLSCCKNLLSRFDSELKQKVEADYKNVSILENWLTTNSYGEATPEESDIYTSKFCTTHFSALKNLLHGYFADPRKRLLDKSVFSLVNDYLSDFDDDKETMKGQLESLVHSTVEEAFYQMGNIHKILFYLAKECAADVMAFKLLKMDMDRYCKMINDARRSKIDTVVTKERSADDLYPYLFALRKTLVCDVFGVPVVDTDGDDDIEDSLTAIEIIKHSYDLIKEYLNQVVGSVDVSADNKARAMYSEIVDSIKAMEAPDDAVDRKDDLPDIIVKYML